MLGPEARWFVEVGTRVGAYCIRPTGRHHRWRMCHRGTCVRPRYGADDHIRRPSIRARRPVWFVGAGTRAPCRGAGSSPRAKPWAGRVPDAVEYGRGGTSIRARRPVWGGVCRCAPGFRRPGFRPGLWSTGPTARPGTSHSGLTARLGGRMQYAPTPLRSFAPRGGLLFILPADGCRDRRRRRRAFRASYRPRPASWDLSASRHRASSAPSVPWAAWDLWDPSAAWVP